MNVNNNYTSIRQIQETYLKNNGTASRARKGESRTFEDILSQKTGLDSEIQSLKFSKHADERLADRNIFLTEDQLGRLAEGARKADEKGIRESLVIMIWYKSCDCLIKRSSIFNDVIWLNNTSRL